MECKDVSEESLNGSENDEKCKRGEGVVREVREGGGGVILFYFFFRTLVFKGGGILFAFVAGYCGYLKCSSHFPLCLSSTITTY